MTAEYLVKSCQKNKKKTADIKSCQKVQRTKYEMESELLNALNYIKNISKKKVTFAKIEAFTRKKERFTCKEDLDNIIDSFIENGLIQVRGDGENTASQITNEVNSSQIPPSPESIDGKENTEKNHIQQNEEKDCTTKKTCKYEPSCHGSTAA